MYARTNMLFCRIVHILINPILILLLLNITIKYDYQVVFLYSESLTLSQFVGGALFFQAG